MEDTSHDNELSTNGVSAGEKVQEENEQEPVNNPDDFLQQSDKEIETFQKKAVQYGETEMIDGNELKPSQSLSLINDSEDDVARNSPFSTLSRYLNKSLDDVRRRTSGSQIFTKSPYVLEIKQFSSKKVFDPST